MQTVSRVKCSPQVSTGESVERKPDASIHLAQQVSPHSLLLPDEQQFPVVLPVVSTKGGEGKSTKAGNIAGYTADAGLKTLLIDGDYNQPTASSIFKLHYEAPCGLYELLMQTADLNKPDSIISRTVIPNLDVIISNDPDDRLSNDMLHAADGRMRLRNVLQHLLFRQYDVIIVDSKGAGGVMVELVVLAATQSVMGVIKPILPDVREFLRGTVRLLSKLLVLEPYGIHIPDIRILANCVEPTVLDRNTLNELKAIVDKGQYPQSDRIAISMLNTEIEQLEVYKRGHACGQPVHRLEYKTDRVSLPAAESMHHLVCELFPQWKDKFDAVLVNRPQPGFGQGADEV
ncbi:Tyrosine-protein kinase CpsD [Salmonella enterica subsp. enterica serovar Typhi]|nr:Tyrosine-protein kinase CpsD [Salmonella enterica subsp. enterica serovar Typhi]